MARAAMLAILLTDFLSGVLLSLLVEKVSGSTNRQESGAQPDLRTD
jgi:hypothetical protein